jgi:hypothetical protein
MPGKDGTGPFGTGPVAGNGGGRRGTGAGPTGYCVCPNCGEKVNHTAGVPCTSLKCPKCGSSLVRGI